MLSQNNIRPIDRYKNKVCEYLSVDDVFLYWKGRVGLYVVLKALNLQQGDEVVVQGYTCVVVANAILYAGATPVFTDIDIGSFCTSAKSIEEKITAKTKVIIAQNTYGLTYQLDSIAVLAKKHGIVTIEDCTHGFGGSYQGQKNGKICDFVFYSTQWNKPFSTGLGGILVVNNQDYLPAVKKIDSECLEPTFLESSQLQFLVQFKSRIVGGRAFDIFRDLYRALSRLGVIPGSSSTVEVQSTEMPDQFLKKFPERLSTIGMKALNGLDEKMTERAEMSVWYSQTLSSMGKNHVSDELFENHGCLTYPLLVEDKEAFAAAARNLRIPLGDWFNSPLHPVTIPLDVWGVDIIELPVATYCSKHVVNLPTDSIDKTDVMKLLEAQCELIIDQSDVERFA